MKRLAPALLGLLISCVIVFTGYAQLGGNIPPFDPTCTPLVHLLSQQYTAGTLYNTQGLEPEYPIWCYRQPNAGPATAIRTANSWVDTWDNTQPEIQTLRDHDYAYRVFPRPLANPANFKMGCFINTDHWMCDIVDVSPFRLSGGILISPDQTFSSINGAVRVEADGAQGTMGGANHYYELDVTNATAPTAYSVDNLYGYGQFGFVGAVGCRFENPAIVCAMYDDSGRATDGRCVGQDGNLPPELRRPCTNGTGGFSGRVWETQGAGTALTGANVQGGYADWPVPGGNGLRVRDVMPSCLTNNTHDLHCRTRLGMELTRTSVHVYANGYPVMLIDGLTSRNSAGQDARIPQVFLDNTRFYMNSWINGGEHVPLRWHWNHVAVNPSYPWAEARSISWCPGQTASDGSPNTCPHGHTPGQPEVGTAGPTSTPLAVPPTATRTSVPSTPTPTPSPTSTPVPPTCEVRVRINGTEQWLAKPATFCQPG